ncbi:hypothetical protein PHLGIDRAFT_108704 [Phlebiopsis gigantea 11061_1 CR5-6]|uniref:Transcription factor TFIIIC triple barrel domain-containing protein n=1 Tax=Phlebiopsis gigantea (strain 11061_1 CR5-6) TaxID=745531 RepID=A0A0C3S4J4_PHLG1|nr:hypothetical protein PHLGIDRAFT_108704 [Phlebiopsis gigantea 11061_1 CR5-6]
MSSSSLFPDHHFVDAFSHDDDYERDEDGNIIEEVEYVTLDLGVVEPTLIPSTSSYRLIGLDTPTPYLQLSGTVFKGKHQSLLGTELLFTDSQGADDASDRGKRSLVHVTNTERRIVFKEVELRPKVPNEQMRQAEAASQQPSAMTSSKKRRPQTLEELVGNEPVGEPAPRGRGGRRARKGKEKELDAEMAHAEDDTPAGEGLRAQGSPMDTS